eukprot:COSAG06_NODE_55563_length_289_cov_0.578947_1_plen_33_part_01
MLTAKTSKSKYYTAAAGDLLVLAAMLLHAMGEL